MSAPEALFESSISSLKLLTRGKVRDIYDIDGKHLLIVTTDRLSAFDVILPDPIPGKGRVLTSVSNFWFDKLQHVIPNHLADLRLQDVLPNAVERAQVEGRAIIVKKMYPLPIEAIVRGYLIGSGWKDYQNSNAICGISLPVGMQLAQCLPEAIFTPSTKANIGAHDENITFETCVDLLGQERAIKIRDTSLKIYTLAAEYAKQRGIIIADTKFEFGVDTDGVLYLIDEVLTPDSSRFWPVEAYQLGLNPPSFDKQFVRDYLDSLDWDKKEPGPALPAQVAQTCSEKYQEAESKLINS
jgi:phosphoribosylaminoimidazole-succinocarboxamide synthase